MEMEGDTAVDSIKIKTMSIKIKAQSEIPRSSAPRSIRKRGGQHKKRTD